jgi:hypothetical protein
MRPGTPTLGIRSRTSPGNEEPARLNSPRLPPKPSEPRSHHAEGNLSATAFGANLLGAMVGGVLEYTALIFGYRWLLILVAVLYSLAFVASRASSRAGGPLPGRVTAALRARHATS